jgi:hypothetical protein
LSGVLAQAESTLTARSDTTSIFVVPIPKTILSPCSKTVPASQDNISDVSPTETGPLGNSEKKSADATSGMIMVAGGEVGAMTGILLVTIVLKVCS